jgi:hypothetical protein
MNPSTFEVGTHQARHWRDRYNQFGNQKATGEFLSTGRR